MRMSQNMTVSLVWEGFRSRIKCGRLHFFSFLVTNTNGHPGKLSIMTSCILILVSLSTCLPCRPCRSVYLVNLSTLSTCQLVILSTLQPIYQFNIHNIIHYIRHINIKWIFKVKSPISSFYRILDLTIWVAVQYVVKILLGERGKSTCISRCHFIVG
jgi:hypothetical protein